MKIIQKGINFIPDFIIAERDRNRRMMLVAVATTIITLFVFAAYQIPALEIYKKNIELENINKEISSLQDINDIRIKFESINNKVNSKKKILEEISKTDIDIIKLTDQLTKAAPTNVALAYISTAENGEINVSYIINNPIEVYNLINNLRDLNIFQKVEMPSIPIVDRKVDIQFKLTLKNNN